jgi:hypothetical protein
MRVRARNPGGLPQLVGVLVLLSTLTAGTQLVHAANPDLRKARVEFDELRFEDAEATLSRTLKSGKNGPDDLVEIYMLAAEIASARGDDAGTFKGFTRALSIKPETPLPSGSSPKVAQQFAKARAWIDANGAITVRYEGDRDKHVLRITVSDEARLVDGVRVYYRDDAGEEQVVTGEGESPMELAVPAREALEVRIVLVDPHGNRVQELGSRKDPLIVATEGEALVGGTLRREPRAWYAKWWLWGGVSLALAGAGTYFGLAALSDEEDAKALIKKSQMTPVPYSELDAIEKRGKRNALFANIGFISAGAVAAFAVYLLVTEPSADELTPADAPPGPPEGLIPVLARDEIGLTWSTTF